MVFSKASLKKLSKEEVINLALDYQSKSDSTLAGIKNEPSELRNDFEKLGSELAVSKDVNGMLEKRSQIWRDKAEVTAITLAENALQ